MALGGLNYANEIRERMVQASAQNKKAVKIEALGRHSMAGQEIPSGMRQTVTAMHEMVTLILHTRQAEYELRNGSIENRLHEENAFKNALMDRIAHREEAHKKVCAEYEQKLEEERAKALILREERKNELSTEKIKKLLSEVKDLREESIALKNSLRRCEEELEKEKEAAALFQAKVEGEKNEKELLYSKITSLKSEMQSLEKESEEKEILKLEVANLQFLLCKENESKQQMYEHARENEKSKAQIAELAKKIRSMQDFVQDIDLSDSEQVEVENVGSGPKLWETKVQQLNNSRKFYKQQYEVLTKNSNTKPGEDSSESSLARIVALTQAADHNGRLAASAEERLVSLKEDFEDAINSANEKIDSLRTQLNYFKLDNEQKSLAIVQLEKEYATMQESVERANSDQNSTLKLSIEARIILHDLHRRWLRLSTLASSSLTLAETKLNKIAQSQKLCLHHHRQAMSRMIAALGEERCIMQSALDSQERKISELCYDREQKEKQIMELWAVKDDREELQERVAKLSVAEKLLVEEQRWKLKCEEKILSLQSELSEAQREAENLRDSSERVKRVSQVLEKEKQELLTKVAYMKELEVFEQSASILNGQIETLTRNVSALTQERDTLLQSLDQASEQLAALKKEQEEPQTSSEVEKLRALAAEREEDLQTLQFQIQEKEVEASHLAQVVQTSQVEARRTKRELSDSVARCQELEERQQGLVDEIESKGKLIAELRNEIRDLQFLVKTDNDSKERMSHELKKKSFEIARLEKDLQDMHEWAQIDNREEEKHVSEDDVHTPSNEEEDEEEPIVEELRETEQQEREKAQKYSKEKLLRKYLVSVRQRLKLLQMVAYLQEEKDRNEGGDDEGMEREDQIGLSDEQMAQLEDFVSALQAQLESEQEKNTEIAERYNELVVIYQEADHKLQTMEKQIQDLKQKDRTGTILNLRQKLSDAEKEIKNLREQSEEYVNHIRNLESYMSERQDIAEEEHDDEYLGDADEYREEEGLDEHGQLEESLEINASAKRLQGSKELIVSQQLGKKFKEDEIVPVRRELEKNKKLEAIRPRFDQKYK